MEPMDRRTWGRLAAGLLGMPLLGGMAACGGSSDDGVGNVRLVNASAGYPSLDFYLDGTLSASSVAYGDVSGYIGTNAAVHTTPFNVAGSSTAVLSQTRSIAKDAPVTLIAYGWAGALKTFALTDTESAPASGYASVLVYNAAPDAGSIDVYVGGTGDDVSNATATAYAVAPNSSDGAGYVLVTAGTYRLRVTASGDATTVLLDTSGLTLGSGQVLCVAVTSGSGGELINALDRAGRRRHRAPEPDGAPAPGQRRDRWRRDHRQLQRHDVGQRGHRALGGRVRGRPGRHGRAGGGCGCGRHVGEPAGPDPGSGRRLHAPGVGRRRSAAVHAGQR